MEMKLLQNDLNQVLNERLNGMAESHIENWGARYKGRTNSEVEYDLFVNHDLSIEHENIQIALKREITDEERRAIKYLFNKEVVKQLFNGAERKVNYRCLAEWQINDFGKCITAYIKNGEFVALKCEKGTIVMREESSTYDEIYVQLYTQGASVPIEHDIEFAITGDVEIANVDVYTSGGTLYLTNGQSLSIELQRDKDLVNSIEYDQVVLATKTSFN